MRSRITPRPSLSLFLFLPLSLSLGACAPHGPRAPESACPSSGPPPVYPGATPLPIDADAVQRRHRARARWEDVLAFYRACYGAREYPFTSRRRASFRLGDARESSSPNDSLRSEFLVLERRPGGVELRVECHGCAAEALAPTSSGEPDQAHE
ncbi:MAG: hypothetical protein H6713_32740 [Myxococcales bacterium]|nr:hypothetical protein [Myxococcales bacterium]